MKYTEVWVRYPGMSDFCKKFGPCARHRAKRWMHQHLVRYSKIGTTAQLRAAAMKDAE